MGREVEGHRARRSHVLDILRRGGRSRRGIHISSSTAGRPRFSLWFINQGRKYVEAPRWAAIGVSLVVLVFVYNVVATALKARKITGIIGVLMVDLVPLFALYLDAFPSITNMSQDLYWWWWLVHLWVEATWEVLIGCIMALALMQLLGTSRRIVETWLYIEVALVLGTGILGLGPSLLLDRDAFLLARHRRVLLRARAAAAAGHGRARGV